MKILSKFLISNKENIVIEVTFLAEDKNEYKSVGVLLKEELDFIRIGFNAIDNKVIDYLDIENTKIISIRAVENAEIQTID